MMKYPLRFPYPATQLMQRHHQGHHGRGSKGKKTKSDPGPRTTVISGTCLMYIISVGYPTIYLANLLQQNF